MKKLLTALVIATTAASASAMPVTHYTRPAPHYNHAYHAGYHNGKTEAYNHVARALVIGGMIVIGGVIIYRLGQESRWGINESGIVYRF